MDYQKLGTALSTVLRNRSEVVPMRRYLNDAIEGMVWTLFFVAVIGYVLHEVIR